MLFLIPLYSIMPIDSYLADSIVLKILLALLDLGFIEVIDHLGEDLTVANSARVSFGKRKKTYDKEIQFR